ncbi:MAG: hypothetical protein C5B50_01505 [Verrucomicrobia bacterium]|nr:MAG: hypothetical protein C5B50_01505 [Verrucomicrobiota bacterium]
MDIIGLDFAKNTVLVNGQTVYRKVEYFRKELAATNSSASQWLPVCITTNGTVNGSIFVPKNPELFTYDPDGNLTSDGRWNYTWDGEDRLISMVTHTTAGPGLKLVFEYDSQSRRISKTVSNYVSGAWQFASKTVFLYDSWNLIAEFTTLNAASAPTLSRSYLWGTDLSGTPQGAGGVGGLLQVSFYGSGTTNCFVAFDGNGNVAGLVNAADGAIFARYEYGPFAEPLRSTGPLAQANPVRFSTKYQDDETDQLYYGYRYFKDGRWTSRDPLEERGGKNLYSFLGGDAINSRDSLGLFSFSIPYFFACPSDIRGHVCYGFSCRVRYPTLRLIPADQTQLAVCLGAANIEMSIGCLLNSSTRFRSGCTHALICFVTWWQ